MRGRIDTNIVVFVMVAHLKLTISYKKLEDQLSLVNRIVVCKKLQKKLLNEKKGEKKKNFFVSGCKIFLS